MNTETAQTCPVCKGRFAPHPLGDKDGYRFLGCRACGSVLTDPWPTAELLEKFYGDIQPEAVHAPNHEKLLADIGKDLQKILPAPSVGKNRLLDINAQRGYTVHAARALGWKATGLNAQDFLHRFAASNYGEENFVHSDTASYAAGTNEKFDVIVAFTAFSEARDLDALAKALAGLLAPDGVLYIEEADGNHFNTPRDLSNWIMVEPPVTGATLSKKGLGKLLGRHGIGFTKTFFTWRPFIRAMAGHSRKK